MRHQQLPRRTRPAALLLAVLLAGCGARSAVTVPGVQESSAVLQSQAVSAPFSRWGVSWTASNWKNGDPLFGCTFSPNNVSVGSGSDQAVYGFLNQSTCAEIKGNRWKGPGSSFGGDLYVPNIAGTTTTVFTYTDNGTLWNEIDAEFVPAKGSLHPALIFRNGGSRYVYEGWRPASSNAWHHVEVKWLSGSITWYLDGQLTFTMYRNTSIGLGATVVSTSASSLQVPAAAWPTQSQQLIANFWRGSNTPDASGFLGTYGGGSGTAIWNNLF